MKKVIILYCGNGLKPTYLKSSDAKDLPDVEIYEATTIKQVLERIPTQGECLIFAETYAASSTFLSFTKEQEDLDILNEQSKLINPQCALLHFEYEVDDHLEKIISKVPEN